MNKVKDDVRSYPTSITVDNAPSEVFAAVTLRFTHDGLVPEYECYDACSRGWTFYIGESLCDLITTGYGHPNEEDRGSHQPQRVGRYPPRLRCHRHRDRLDRDFHTCGTPARAGVLLPVLKRLATPDEHQPPIPDHHRPGRPVPVNNLPVCIERLGLGTGRRRSEVGGVVSRVELKEQRRLGAG